MYLDNGREIYESDDYPGYYIDANTGAFCDEEGNYVGGNVDNGDKPGDGGVYSPFYNITVWVTKSGKFYYPCRTKTAIIPMRLSDAITKDLMPSKGYQTFLEKKFNKKNKIHRRKNK